MNDLTEIERHARRVADDNATSPPIAIVTLARAVADIAGYLRTQGEARGPGADGVVPAVDLEQRIAPTLAALERQTLERAAAECERYRQHALETFVRDLSDLQGPAMMAATDCAHRIRALKGGGR